jgi:hypothetical protein
VCFAAAVETTKDIKEIGNSLQITCRWFSTVHAQFIFTVPLPTLPFLAEEAKIKIIKKIEQRMSEDNRTIVEGKAK